MRRVSPGESLSCHVWLAWDEHKESLVEMQGWELSKAHPSILSGLGSLWDGGFGSAGLAVGLSHLRGLFQPKRTSSQWEDDTTSQSGWMIFILNPERQVPPWTALYIRGQLPLPQGLAQSDFVESRKSLKYPKTHSGPEYECAAGFSGFSCPHSLWKGPGWLNTRGDCEQKELTHAAPSCSSEHTLVHGSV